MGLMQCPDQSLSGRTSAADGAHSAQHISLQQNIHAWSLSAINFFSQRKERVTLIRILRRQPRTLGLNQKCIRPVLCESDVLPLLYICALYECATCGHATHTFSVQPAVVQATVAMKLRANSLVVTTARPQAASPSCQLSFRTHRDGGVPTLDAELM